MKGFDVDLKFINSDVGANIPVKDEDETMQVRHDGILINGSLYVWEEIESVTIRVLR